MSTVRGNSTIDAHGLKFEFVRIILTTNKNDAILLAELLNIGRISVPHFSVSASKFSY